MFPTEVLLVTLYQVNFDATMITLWATDEDDVCKQLMEQDDTMKYVDGELVTDWDEKVNISKVEPKRGIIQWESH